ncbi:FliM/FliN family flagellar motor switch protein [Thioclava sp. 15-R06ZXC-3]|uniref:FliM/FliN family flagellar motor switch protein n=1 Tax=Thioclava arctica TaxID=3238301 RepID=A0ABV3TH77_9RHOB
MSDFKWMEGMAPEQGKSVLRKKAEAGRPVADGAVMSAERAISSGLAKVAQDMLTLPLRVTALEETRRSLADLPETLEDLSLLALIEGPSEALGLIALPPATLQALIEMQTMGRLSKTPPGPRKPTRIDAAMAVDFIDSLLTSIETSLIEDDAISWAGGFRYASYLDDPRPLGLLLEDVTFRVWTVQFVLGESGEREGAFLWAVPQKGRGAHLKRDPSVACTGDEAGAHKTLAALLVPPWEEQIERTVMSTPAELTAVLHRMTLPLSAVLNFKPGMELPLPADSLEQITLEAQGRRKLSFARLGQSRGNRALRLTGAERAATDHEAPDDTLSVGASPFEASGLPEAPLGGLGDPMNTAYDDDASVDLDALGGFGAADDLPDLGGFAPLPEAETATDDLPPLKIGSGF